jgi:hypothetical protein
MWNLLSTLQKIETRLAIGRVRNNPSGAEGNVYFRTKIKLLKGKCKN